MPETKVTLYDTASEIAALLNVMEESDTAPTPEMEQAIAAALEQHLRKVDNLARFKLNLKSQIGFAEEEIKRLTARKRQLELHDERLDNYTLRVMDQHGWTELNGETADIKIRQNPPAVQILDETAIPPEFVTVKQQIAIDKNGIKARIKAGKEVPGAALTQTRKVVIK